MKFIRKAKEFQQGIQANLTSYPPDIKLRRNKGTELVHGNDETPLTDYRVAICMYPQKSLLVIVRGHTYSQSDANDADFIYWHITEFTNNIDHHED